MYVGDGKTGFVELCYNMYNLYTMSIFLGVIIRLKIVQRKNLSTINILFCRLKDLKLVVCLVNYLFIYISLL